MAKNTKYKQGKKCLNILAIGNPASHLRLSSGSKKLTTFWSLPRPSDGGGCQGISNLLILDNLMKSIVKQRGLKRNQTLRPCDVFDVICGVGSGGWLAFLLGRFKLSIPECMYEYCDIAKSIVRPDTLKAKWNHHKQHSVHDISRLLKYVEHLTQKYRVGDYLLAADTDNVRCKLAFAVASYQTDEGMGPGYCLFRTYKTEFQGSEMSPDPATTRISEAFAATGAKKGFLYPFKKEVGGITLDFGNEAGIFPDCLTNATMIALEEVARVFGDQGRISTVVNIGPGVPGTKDIKRISSMVSRSSWNSISSKSSEGSGSTDSSKSLGNLKQHPTHVGCRRLLQVISRYMERRPKPAELQRRLKDAQTNKFHQIEKRVSSIGDEAIYKWLGPENAPEGVVFSDVAHMAPDRIAPEQAQKEAVEYLSAPEVKDIIETLTRKILSAMGTAVEGTGTGTGQAVVAS